MEPIEAHVQYRVPYAETDRMGVVYYGHYLVYFERARTALLQQLGFPYTELERRGYGLPVTEAHVEYKASAGYDDVLDITGQVAWVKGARLRVDCSVYCNDVLLARGYTVHACVELDTLKPVRVLPELAKCCSAKAPCVGTHGPQNGTH